MKGDAKTLIVYVDDSLFAAELNAQRELIKLHLLELFGEDIDDFQIKTSRWKKYRENHPYVIEEAEITNRNIPSIPLSDEERLHVANISARIDDEKIRNTFEKAMTADLEWKKGEKVDNTPKN